MLLCLAKGTYLRVLRTLISCVKDRCELGVVVIVSVAVLSPAEQVHNAGVKFRVESVKLRVEPVHSKGASSFLNKVEEQSSDEVEIPPAPVVLSGKGKLREHKESIKVSQRVGVGRDMLKIESSKWFQKAERGEEGNQEKRRPHSSVNLGDLLHGGQLFDHTSVSARAVTAVHPIVG